MSGVVYNHYQVLGVSEFATAEEIRAAYKTLAKKYHPDKHGGHAFYEEHFKKINAAYQVLSDPEKRTRYDIQRRYQYVAPKGTPPPPHAAPRRPRPRRPAHQTPPQPEGLTHSQLKKIGYAAGVFIGFIFLVIQFYNWMNHVAAEQQVEKGLALEKQKMNVAAYGAYLTALDFEPENSKALFRKGVLAWTLLHHSSEALTSINLSINYTEQAHWEMYYYKGICHLWESDPDDAIFSFEQALKIKDCPDSVLVNLGDAFFTKHLYLLALDEYSKYLIKHPTDANALIKRGVAHHRLQHKVIAMNDFAAAIKLVPDNAPAYFYRALVKFSLGDESGGEADLDSAAAQDFKSAIRLQNERRREKMEE